MGRQTDANLSRVRQRTMNIEDAMKELAKGYSRWA